MRAKWNKRPGGDEELHLHSTAGWIYMGWVQPTIGGFNVLCCWLESSAEDYPETKIFETAKQARRALKASAIVAFIGGFRGRDV